MRLVLENADDFRKSVEAIATLIDEAEFILDDKALSLKATDPSQISMVDFRLEKKAFKEFQPKEGQRLGMDLDYLSQIMSRAKAKEQLITEPSEDNAALQLTLKGISTRKFRVPLIDVSGQQLPSPKIDFESSVLLRAGVVQDALKDAALVSTHVSLGVEGKSFFVKAHSSKGSVNNETPKDNENVFELNAKKACHAMFPLDYLSDMLKVASSDSRVLLELKTDAPIRVSYEIGQAQIAYYLAPRIEAD